MDTNNTTSRQPLTVGPSTENLLLALRSVEDARTHYFTAFEAVGAAASFVDLRDMIAAEISSNVQAWAESSNPAKVL